MGGATVLKGNLGSRRVGPGAKQVRSAEYDVDTRVMSMSFWDGDDHRIESGDEE